jgi:succinyl-CoA synthetase alpha subunit
MLHRPLLFVDSSTKVVLQSLGGHSHVLHSMLSFGTNVVGVSGATLSGSDLRANASLVLLPPPLAAQAIVDASAAGLSLVVCATPGVPAHDLLRAKDVLAANGTELIGPGSWGIVHPRLRISVGAFDTPAFAPGRSAVAGCSNELVYEVVLQTTAIGLGQSFAVGLGGDPFAGQLPIDIVKRLAEDPVTDGIVLIGKDDEAVRWIRKAALARKKPIVAYEPGGRGVETLRDVGIRVVRHPGTIGRVIFEEMRKRGIV